MNITKLKDAFKSFKSNRKGNVALTFAVTALPIIFSIGAAVDYSRYSRGFDRMVSAGDTAIIAASKFMTHSGEDDDDLLRSELEDQFDNFMEANFTAAKYGITFTYDLAFDRDNNAVTVNIHGEQNTTFLRLAGFNTLGYSSVLGTRLEITPENYVIDIVMCIDATGSMQNTLNAVQANAATFDTQLRSELNIAANDERFKIRIRPIYYRDYEDALAHNGWEWTTTPSWGYIRPNGYWVYGYYTINHIAYYHPYDLTRAIKPASDFFDLDDSADATEFQAFLDSETAKGGGNLPEASGACINEGMRSDWYDREETTDFPEDENLTVFPIVVVWTDAAIRTLSVTQQISPTQPTSYSSFKTEWESAANISQDPKLLILFGPQNSAGWNNIKTWDNYSYGGPLTTGNSDAIAVIADNIIKTLPDVLRLTY